MADLNNNNVHGAVEYQEALRNQIGLRAQYIRILREEYVMTHENNPPPLNFDGNITEELKEILAKKKSKKGKGYNSYTYYQSKRREGDKKWQELTKKEQEEWKSKAILENKVSYIMIKI